MNQYKISKTATFTGHSGSIYALAEGPEPFSFFSGGNDRTVAAWNLDSLQPENFSIKLDASVFALHYLPEENLLLIGDANGNLYLVDVVSKIVKGTIKPHLGAIFSIRYYSTEKKIISSSADGSVALTNLEDLNFNKTEISGYKVRGLDISNDWLAVSSGDCSVRIFQLPDMKMIENFGAHNLSANTVRFIPKSKKLLSGGRDAFLNYWVRKDKYEIYKSIPAHNFAIYGIEFNADASLFATASRDKSIKIWESVELNLVKRIDSKSMAGHTGSVNSILWHQKKDVLISAGDDKRIISWQIKKN
jgi:WD40 repeat protein